jgi:cellulose synthase/poly-beta-1,6-N-acetylglucosamine synthase-like glycosyltransferase/spore germination protein YaaH/peptidoglycan/xylan/chitin deacetylase (PgdA/CDA1 family)
MQDRQIFQTVTSTRWTRFKWSSRVFFLFIGLAILAIIFWFITEKLPTLPQLASYKQVLSAQQNFLSRNSQLAKKYKGYRQYINQKDLTNKAPYKMKTSPGYRNIINNDMPCGIRSAFYVTWNKQSLISLERNIHKLNLVIPEWLFINPKADTVYSTIDPAGLAVMKNAGVNIMPMLSNFYDKDKNFHGEAVHRIINNKAKREKLINDLINILLKNKFAGVNVDLEELKETSDEAFVAFQKELYDKLHARKLLVTQDVIPFNEDYNYEALSRYNDFLFVMAYDENSSGTKPGPIAEQKWIEAAMDQALKKIPSHKVVLGLAAYGYDWPVEKEETDPADVAVLTYQDALSAAKEAQAKIIFDNDTYNLSFSYYDDENILHQAYFTDAATTFNAMRFATESELAGVALWRLGSEDDRIWNFYNKNLSQDSIKHFDFDVFSQIQSKDNVTYSGFGEVLDVLAMPKKGSIQTTLDSTELLISEENYDNLPSSFMAKKFGWNGKDTIRNKKKLVLTFDDGPDPTWTPKILDVLSEKHVPASFFIVGMNGENNIPLLKRIYREGHELGDHTFTHPNIAEVSHRRAVIEMESTRLLIECVTGHSTVLFRAPYNADFTPEKLDELIPVAIARTKNYLDVGESIDPLDWEPGINADSIFQRTIKRKKELEMDDKTTGGNIILLHDAGGETREATLEALPKIIDYFKERGYTFTTIADLLGKKKEELMPPVPKGSGYYLLEANYVFLEVTYWIGTVLFALFITFILLSIARTVLMAFLALKERKLEKSNLAAIPFVLDNPPLVSVIVPAYNEEINIVSSLQNLLKADYPNYEIIFVDDGSTDDTYARVIDVFKGNGRIKAYTKPNGGKASALNYGIGISNADFVVCIDADTKLKTDAISHLMKHFLLSRDNQDLEKIGAVAGNVKVGNELNLLTKWQAIEYISSQNFDRRAFAYLNAITVVPGAIGAFRKKAIEAAGGFTTDTLAEDCDLTIRILRAGYVIKNENNAIALTEAPEKTKQFLKQRLRWSFGVLQTFWKHKDVLFNTNYKWLGCLAMPNILLFQYIIPAFIPFADLFMVVGLISGNAGKIIPYYFAFMLFDAGIAIIAFRMEKERLSRLVWLFPQRLIYRWLMWWVLFKSLRRALKGELQTWGVLKRTGNVIDVDSNISKAGI